MYTFFQPITNLNMTTPPVTLYSLLYISLFRAFMTLSMAMILSGIFGGIIGGTGAAVHGLLGGVPRHQVMKNTKGGAAFLTAS